MEILAQVKGLDVIDVLWDVKHGHTRNSSNFSQLNERSGETSHRPTSEWYMTAKSISFEVILAKGVAIAVMG